DVAGTARTFTYDAGNRISKATVGEQTAIYGYGERRRVTKVPCPWQRLSDGIDLTVSWRTFPGIVVACLLVEPHNVSTPMVSTIDFLIYGACGHFFVRRREKRGKDSGS